MELLWYGVHRRRGVYSDDGHRHGAAVMVRSANSSRVSLVTESIGGKLLGNKALDDVQDFKFSQTELGGHQPPICTWYFAPLLKLQIPAPCCGLLIW